MASTILIHTDDTPKLRKERGAFFTPDGITEFVAKWAIQSGSDRLNPGRFLAAMVDRVLGATPVTMHKAARKRRAEPAQL